MLLSGLPLSNVLTAISPNESTLALTFVIDEVSVVLLPVFPGQITLAIHLVLLPIASI